MIGAFGRLRAARVLVIGDFMLDVYTRGKVTRLSPEAPVPILRVQHTETLPGGAGNVVFNLKALGARVIPVGRVGKDRAGDKIKAIFEREGIETDGLFVDENWETPVKNRLIADGQQLIRVDEERTLPLSPKLEELLMAFILEQRLQLKVIALSDYAKGTLSMALLRGVIEKGRQWGIPVLVDPKGENFTKYSGATLITPNLTEAYAATQFPMDRPLSEVGRKLLSISRAESILITRSEKGMALFKQGQEPLEFPAKAREVKDVTGAGDTVLAMVAMTLASDIDLIEGLYLANIAAGLAVERMGCARISLAVIAERLIEAHLPDKIFDEKHLFVLERILADKQVTILGLPSAKHLSTDLFDKVQSIGKKKQNERLLVYVMSTPPEKGFIALLSSLHEVDFIVLQSNHLNSLCERITPERVFVLEGETLTLISSAKTLLTSEL